MREKRETEKKRERRKKRTAKVGLRFIKIQIFHTCRIRLMAPGRVGRRTLAAQQDVFRRRPRGGRAWSPCEEQRAQEEHQ